MSEARRLRAVLVGRRQRFGLVLAMIAGLVAYAATLCSWMWLPLALGQAGGRPRPIFEWDVLLFAWQYRLSPGGEGWYSTGPISALAASTAAWILACASTPSLSVWEAVRRAKGLRTFTRKTRLKAEAQTLRGEIRARGGAGLIRTGRRSWILLTLSVVAAACAVGIAATTPTTVASTSGAEYAVTWGPAVWACLLGNAVVILGALLTSPVGVSGVEVLVDAEGRLHGPDEEPRPAIPKVYPIA
jgi:hypothetical protein